MDTKFANISVKSIKCFQSVIYFSVNNNFSKKSVIFSQMVLNILLSKIRLKLVFHAKRQKHLSVDSLLAKMHLIKVIFNYKHFLS